jgi:tight adherence protein B
MPIEQTYLLYGLVFLGVLLFVEGAYYFFRDTKRDSERAANQRMRLRASGMEGREVIMTLRRDVDKTSVWMVGPLKRINGLISESGLVMSSGRFFLIMAGLTIFLLLGMSYLAGAPVILALPFAILLGVGAPVLYLMGAKRRRLNRFAEQMPDALDIIVRSLRAGHPITSAIGLVAKEMPDPIGTEFGLLIDEMTYGLELTEALERMRLRVDHPDLQFMVVTVTIQHGTGGNLAEVLANLSGVIRDRYRLYKKVDALSAEGRISGVVLASLPFVVGIIMYVVSPTAKYYMEAAKTPIFAVVLLVSAVWYLLSLYVMYKIIKIRV